MGKRNIETSKEEQPSFPKFKSYSIDEILAAGGPTVFAEKMGKSWEGLLDALKKLPKHAFLTEEEAETALKMLRENK